MRAVIDTGVLVSALIRHQGIAGQVLQALRDGRFALVYSVPMLTELVEVLSRSKIRQKYSIRAGDITALVYLVRLRGELINPTRTIHACRDPKDDVVIATAVAAHAEYIVTNDRDLHEAALVTQLHDECGIHVVWPNEFLEALSSAK